MTIWERVTIALTALNVPMAQDKYVVESGQEFPDAYIVWFLVSGVPEQWADNQEKGRSYLVQVNYFSKDGLLSLPNIDGVMLGAGFLKGNLIPFPLDDSGYYGLGTVYRYVESEE